MKAITARTEFESKMYERVYLKAEYQHRLLLIRNILEIMSKKPSVKPSDLLAATSTWERMRKYLREFMDKDLVKIDSTSSINAGGGSRRRAKPRYQLTHKGHKLLYKIKQLEETTNCNLEKFCFVDIH